MFAIVSIAGKQYIVKKGDVVTVDRLPEATDAVVRFDKVLLTDADGKVTLGAPYIKDAVVTGKVLAQMKGKKLMVGRYKSKVRYRKTTGFRPYQSKVEITAVA